MRPKRITSFLVLNALVRDRLVEGPCIGASDYSTKVEP